MKRIKELTCVGALILGACGEGPKERADQQSPEASGEMTEAEAQVPTLLVARVPVDAEGNEDLTQVEVRPIQSFSGSADGVASRFDASQDVEVQDELDEDSSSNQWRGRRWSWYWGTPWYPGKLLGRGLWWGRNPYAYGYGRRYHYGYHRNYHRRGYNYYSYCYRRYRGCW